MTQNQNPPESTSIYEVTTYCDEHGRQVRRLRKIIGSPSSSCGDGYRGAISVQLESPIPSPGGGRQVMNINLDFDIEGAASIEQAFGLFDACVEPAVREYMHKKREEALNAPKILRAGGG